LETENFISSLGYTFPILILMERYKITLILVVSLILGGTLNTIFGQDSSSANKTAVSAEESHDAKEGQDKEFYEYYYKTQIENLPLKKAKLEYNLIKTMKKEIRSRDFSKATLELTKKIDASNIKYERVYRDSKWVRGFLTQMPHLSVLDFMYVVKHDKYMCFMTFETNPESYLQEARQSQLIFSGTDKFEIVIPKP
jgi:hypothetical protein